MSDDAKRRAVTFSQLGLGMAIFGSATPVSKIVTSAMPIFVGSGLRVLIGALILAPFLFQRPRIRTTPRQWLLTTLIAAFGMFGFSALMLAGMKQVSGVVGAVVMSTTPAVTAAASMLFMHDKPTWRKLTAVGLAVVGVLVLHLGQAGSERSEGDLVLGSAMIFGAVCCEATYTLLGKRLSEQMDPILVAARAAAISLPLFLPFAIWQWPDFDPQAIGVSVWAALIWYGAGTLALGTWLWYSGVRKAEGAVAAGFMSVMPVSALLLSYVLLGEPFRWIHLAGFGIVGAGVVLISWEHARMSSSETD